MGTAFRRSYRDKKTGKTKRVRTYSIKFQNSQGPWVTEPTEAVQKHVAQRLLGEREREVHQQLALGLLRNTPLHPISASEPGDTRPAASAILLEELRDLYLPSVRVRLKPSTAKMYQEVLGYILPRLKAQTVPGLTLQHIEQFMQDRLKGGTAPRTINIQVAVLNRMLNWAEKQGIIPGNPIGDWQPLREVPRRKRRAMLPEEVRQLLAVAPIHRRIVYAMFLASGVRRGELLQLERSDLDLERGMLVVRPELTKSGKGRRVFLPRGLVDLLREYLARDVQERTKRQDAYLCRIRKRLASMDAAVDGDSPTAERLRYLEELIRQSRGHQYLLVNGKGLPIRKNCNLLREFRKDMKKAGINPAGLDLHALRHTTNTTLLRGGVNPSIIRARLGHTTARMTETYTDKDALDQGGETAPIAALLGVADGETGHGDGDEQPSGHGQGLTLDEGEVLRPTPAVLAALLERYSNILIARLFRVSEMSVRKWLQKYGLFRQKHLVTKEMTEVQVALLRAELRAAMADEPAGCKARATSKDEPTAPKSRPSRSA